MAAESAVGPLIHGIPLALWVAIGVGISSPILSLIGVWWASRISRANLKLQLAESGSQQTRQLTHDAAQRALERKMALRKDVYIPAAAGISHQIGLLFRLVAIGEDLDAIRKENSDDVAAIAKVHVVGNKATIDAVMRYEIAFDSAFI